MARTATLSGVVLALLVAGCDRPTPPTETGARLTESSHAKVRVAAVRTGFGLRAGVATGFERIEGAGIRPLLSTSEMLRTRRAARVELPVSADGAVRVRNSASSVEVSFRLRGAAPSAVENADGYLVYPRAVRGADLLHRVDGEGTEDYVVFNERPSAEQLDYDVDVSRVRGLRLVANTLEFLDGAGLPSLRIAPPWVVGAGGLRRDAKISVTGCEYEANRRAPYGSPVVPPGATHCAVRIAWSNVPYPAVVDPTWSGTDSLATARSHHTATVLPSGRVLIAGGIGQDGAALASAELFDPTANGGIGAFVATDGMGTARGWQTANLLTSGKVLVAGGKATSDGGSLTSAEWFDPTADGGVGTFVDAPPMGTARSRHTASLLLTGKIFVAGGTGADSSALSSTEMFDPTADSGKGAFAALDETTGNARSGHTASVLADGRVLLAGGTNQGTVLLLDLIKHESEFAAYDGPYADHSAVVLPTGEVLLFGGFLSDVPGRTTKIFIFDPANRPAHPTSMATIGDMVSPRSDHAVTLLPSGKVLVAGGGSDGEIIYATTEVFDPKLKKSTAIGSMTATRDGGHTLSVLASGKVLVVGGTTGFRSSTLASAEILGTTGETCTTSADCLGETCVDGVCCASACSGQCEACDLPDSKGTCMPVKGAPRNARAACATGDANAPCAAAKCDGSERTSCAEHPGAETMCQPASCLDRRASAARTCNGKGDCEPAPEPATCGSYQCDPLACKTSCNTVADCIENSACDPATHKCVPGALCDGDHTITNPDGTKRDCAPYQCTSDGTCQTACASVSNCVAPTVCDANGKCVENSAPTDSAKSDSDAGGCMAAPTGQQDVWQLVILGGLLFVKRRRRKAGAS